MNLRIAIALLASLLVGCTTGGDVPARSPVGPAAAAAAVTAEEPADEGPTRQELLDVAREAARESGSREVLAMLAAGTLRYDREHAVADHLAAADTPVAPSDKLWLLCETDLKLAEGLRELGEADRANELLAERLRSILADAPPPYSSEASRGGQACTVSLALWPAEKELVREALGKAEQWLGEEPPTHWWQLLEKVDPERYALLRSDSEIVRTRVALARRIETDPLAVYRDLRGGELDSLHGIDHVHMLVAELMRIDPPKALDVAEERGLMTSISSNSEEMSRPIIDAMLEFGVTELPMAAEWDAYYRRLAGYMVPLDLEAALTLAGRLVAPEERGSALWAIAERLTELDRPEEARAVVERLVALHDAGEAVHASSLSRAARVLISHHDDLVPELLDRAGSIEDWSITWQQWWDHDHEAAEAWLDGRSEVERLEALAATVWRMGLVGDRDAAVARARKIVASPDYPETGPRGASLPWALARIAPGLGHEAWEKLPRLEMADADVSAISRTVFELLNLADGLDAVEPGSADAEVAEVGRILDAAPDHAHDSLIGLRARYAALLASREPDRARRIALEVLDTMGGSGVDDNTMAEARRNAARALALADCGKAISVLRAREDLRSRDSLLHGAVAAVAERDAHKAFVMVEALSPEEDRRWLLKRVAWMLGKSARPEAVGAFIDRWLVEAPDRQQAVLDAMEAVLRSRRTELSHLVIFLLSNVADDDELPRAVAEESANPSYLTEVSTDALVELRERLPLDAPGSEVARHAVTAALAERDWPLGQELLAQMSPAERVDTLLTIMRMRDRLIPPVWP